MKKTFKLTAFLLICAILVSVLPLGGISSAEQTTADILLMDFDQSADVSSHIFSADLNAQVSAEFDTEHKYTENGKSVEITTIPAASAGYRRARFTGINATDSSALGFKIWMKNPSQNGIGIAVQFITKSNGTWINMKPNQAYYTADMLGEVSQHIYTKKVDGTTEGCIYLEAGFEGFVYLPLSCGYSSVKADNVSIIALSAYTKPDAPVIYYVDEISTYSDIGGEDWIIRRFSEYETTAEMKSQMYIHGSQSVELDAISNACVIDTGTAGKTSGVSFQFGGNAVYNNHTGMKVRVKASDVADTDILFKWEAKEHRPLKSGAAYYLVDLQGNIYSKKASSNSTAALITLPAAFDGWIYVPFASAYPMTYSDIYRLYLNAVIEDVEGRNLTVYEVSLYKELPIKDGAAFVINDFEDYASTKNVKDTLVYGNTTALTLELADVWGSKALKFSQADKNINASFAVSFGASSMPQNFTGFKVRIKVNKNANVLIKSEDAQHRPMKPQSLYYLVSTDGRAYSYKTSTDSASYVQFTAGFDGWIYIPFSSLYDIDLTKAYRLWFNPEKTNAAGTEFVIDDIVFYSGNPTVINDTPIAFERVLPYNPDNTILDFDSCNTTADMTKKIKIHSANGVAAELDSTVAQNKNSCKFTFDASGGKVETIVEFEKNSYFSEITGFRFWVKASEAQESVTLLYKLETSEHRPIKRSAAYYLADIHGKVSKRSASANNEAALISLPAGYEGWVYVPFGSIYPMNIKDLYRIWFNLTASENASKNIWLDSIECYTDNPVVTNGDVINDFDYYSSTADIRLDSAFEAQTDGDNFSVESAWRDGTSGKSLKLKTVYGNYKFTFSSEGRTEYDGFTFYVKNPSEKAVYLLTQTDSAGRDSFVPGRAYYLENKNTGAVEMKRFGKMVVDAGNIEIPAGFEGYVYLPYSSAYPSLQNNMDKLNAFWITIPKAIVTDTEVYVDTIAFYKNATCRISSILVWKQDTAGMIYGFEKSNSIAGYRGWISGAENFDVSINKTHSHSGTNSLKISTPITSDEETKDGWAVTQLSLKNEDGTYNDMSMYDGIAFWIKVERDGTDTKPVEDKVKLGFKVNMPSHGRLYTTSPIYILKDGNDITEPDVFTTTIDGCTAVTLNSGFSGMIYIPYSALSSFANDKFGVTEGLTDIFIMFRLYSLIGYNVYIDDVQGYNMKNLLNVAWPGDAEYDPLSDPMLKAVAKTDNSGNGISAEKNPVDNHNGTNYTLPIVLGSVGAVLVAAVAVFVILLILKKKKSQKV